MESTLRQMSTTVVRRAYSSLLPLLAAVAVACHGSPQEPSQLARDTVYISPQFVDTVTPDQALQLDGAVALDGTRLNSNGAWAYAGDTVVVRVSSPSSFYEAITDTIIVPDTVARASNSLRRYYPIVTLRRLIPAVLRARWAADFTGPTIALEIYAPFGLAGVRLPDVSVYWQACLNSSNLCDVRIFGRAGGSPWYPDASTTGLRGWAHLTGPWVDWPSALPPAGYGDGGWQATLNVNIEDDHGHRGHGACGGGFIPSFQLELTCDVLFLY